MQIQKILTEIAHLTFYQRNPRISSSNVSFIEQDDYYVYVVAGFILICCSFKMDSSNCLYVSGSGILWRCLGSGSSSALQVEQLCEFELFDRNSRPRK